MHDHEERPEWGSVYVQNEAMKDIFARCLKMTAVQVCTLITMHCRHVSTCMIRLFDYLLPLFLHLGNPICTINWWLFSQVKNKPWRTWVYTWFWHCRQHWPIELSVTKLGHCQIISWKKLFWSILLIHRLKLEKFAIYCLFYWSKIMSPELRYREPKRGQRAEEETGGHRGDRGQ